ncbi:MAG TPA: TAT-variant-translocated molybdopterin oxidoreductase [Pyrinomonadaceae bacterium]
MPPVRQEQEAGGRRQEANEAEPSTSPIRNPQSEIRNRKMDDRHINFKLMSQYILDHQDEAVGAPAEKPAVAAKKYWRSLEELADAPEFREFVSREYPQHAECWDDPVARRSFLKLMGASLALAGLSGCVFQPPEKIVPSVTQPEYGTPGKALFFATALTLGGVATPLLARSNEGRPTKLEGNPDHPQNLSANAGEVGSSATDIFSQASILGLYDPDRAQTTLFRDETRPWTTFVGELRTALDGLRPQQGTGIHFLTETITSPSLAEQLKGILTEFPQAKWHQYEPVNNDQAHAGARMAFGQPVNTIYDFSKADRILSLDADFLAAMPGTLRYARDFGARRRVSEGKNSMNRLYVIETTPTTTGAAADHHWAIRPSEFVKAAASIAAGVGVASQSGGSSITGLDAIARDLQQHRGRSVVIAGREAPPAVHALAHAMNGALGNVGQTVFYTDPLEVNPADHRQSLQELVHDLDGGRVKMLVMIGGNPVYNTPADLKLNQERFFKAELRIHLSQYRDETSELCHWHIPATHYLEEWSDTRAFDGTVSIVQPLIEPLYQGRSAHELLAVFSPQYDRKPYDIIREYWQRNPPSGDRQQTAGAGTPVRATASPLASPQASPQATAAATPAAAADFETNWRRWVHDGFIPNTALPIKTVSVNTAGLAQALTNNQQSTSGSQLELVIRTDPTIYDGRFANNGWLQELPKPLSKLTWDNAALISPNTAQQLGLKKAVGQKGGDIWVDTIRISNQGRNVSGTIPTWITPGQPDGVITVHLGYGRRLAGRVGNGHGFNAYEIRTSDSPWSANGIQVEKTGEQYVVAATQLHFNMEDHDFSKEDRDILRATTVEDYLHPKHEEHAEHHEGSMYEPFDYKNQGMGYAWGMAIDLNNCIGCNACTIACQSENNIPVVGKEEVIRSREMHWIRVDTYFKGDNPSSPEGTHFMPVPCMHCEKAPCEPVCPVHATVHSTEGLNDMVYNRCVGTKYCSNNCPYKVRRFNFFLYQDWETPTYQLMRNPDVSVRSRGVMEKCTYCVQRIQSAKIQSELEDRKVRDGEIVTACQAVCPTEAIVFGDINDPNSRVSKLKADHRNYSVLEELNTKPRTTYLTALKNPNPEIREV